jgi:hypothetical protein
MMCLWRSLQSHAIQAAEKKTRQELLAAQQVSRASQNGLTALGRELADANAKVSCPHSFQVRQRRATQTVSLAEAAPVAITLPE